MNFIQSQPYAAGGQVQPEVGSFEAAQWHGANAHVAGLKIWIRKWDGRRTIGGIQVFYSNGQHPIHGCNTSKEAIEFRMDKDERITKIDIGAGFLIDSLTFHTNKGDVFGPYGGTGGATSSDTPQGGSGHLAGISGTIVQTQGLQALTKLRFTWACPVAPPAPSYQESSVFAVTSPNLKVLESFDGRSYATGGARISGLKLWVRRSEKPVVAGIQVRFTNGQAATFGGTFPKEIHEFVMQPDEKLTQVQLYLGTVVEGLTFTSNKGRVFGPYGGTTGASIIERPNSGTGGLAWFSGTIVQSLGGKCFTDVKFTWEL
jgi:hypothetical protein